MNRFIWHHDVLVKGSYHSAASSKVISKINCKCRNSSISDKLSLPVQLAEICAFSSLETSQPHQSRHHVLCLCIRILRCMCEGLFQSFRLGFSYLQCETVDLNCPHPQSMEQVHCMQIMPCLVALLFIHE